MIGINHFAGLSLIDPELALTEDIFTLGTKGSVDLFASYVNQGKYNFENLAPHKDLEQRGFIKLDQHGNVINKEKYYKEETGKYKDKVTNKEYEVKYLTDAEEYQFRADSLRLYDEIRNFISDYINVVFPSDWDIEHDQDIKELAKFLKATIPNWRNELKTKKDVIDFSATLWWVCTGYHSLSFSVRDYETYIPFRPTCTMKPMPLLPHQ
jgi:hypothetical protein